MITKNLKDTAKHKVVLVFIAVLALLLLTACTEPPVAVDDLFSMDEDTTITGNVLAANPDGPAAQAMVGELQPALILLDGGWADADVRAMLKQLMTLWPQARCVVFVDGGESHLAQEAGADVVLVKGVRAATILETIEGLLSEDSQA